MRLSFACPLTAYSSVISIYKFRLPMVFLPTCRGMVTERPAQASVSVQKLLQAF